MGTIQHHAVIATTYKYELVDGIREWVKTFDAYEQNLFLFQPNRTINGFQTVVLSPDGSKEGWRESDRGDSLRETFIGRLEADKWDDGSSPWKWMEVTYGECGAEIVSTNVDDEVGNNDDDKVETN